MKNKYEDRKVMIINTLETKHEVDTVALSQSLNVSEMTIRRDLKRLETEGILKRTLRGAISTKQPAIDDSIQSRISENREPKAAICRCAARFINDYDIVMIDASTTALGLCNHIKDKKITVVTNSINVASALVDSDTVNVVVTGGILRKSSVSMIGDAAVEAFSKLNIQKAFISGKAFSLEDGLTDINLFEIQTKIAAIAKSKEVNVLIDNHKLNKVSLQKICDVSAIQRVVIDGLRPFTADEERTLQKLREAGIDVIIAK